MERFDDATEKRLAEGTRKAVEESLQREQARKDALQAKRDRSARLQTARRIVKENKARLQAFRKSKGR